MTSCGIIYIPGFMTIYSGIQVLLSNLKILRSFSVGIIDEKIHKDRSRTSKVVKGDTHTDHRQQYDLISLLLVFIHNRESKLNC
jgi:hypothetical protein